MQDPGDLEGFVDALRAEGVAAEALRQTLAAGADSAFGLGAALLSAAAATPQQLEAAQRRWAEASSASNDAPSSLGAYVVERLLGRGGMGEVYLVRDPQRGVAFAAKRLAPSADVECRARFAREARLMAALRHPHLVDVHTAELEGPAPYYVMTYCPGGSLADRLAQGPLDGEAARALMLQLGRGLAAAHAAGVLHRDLKPDNVVFDAEGRPRLTDFGLSRALTAQSNRLTQTGEILGTPNYMAPEQVRDSRLSDARSDVYGLGGILYACLSGQPPIPPQPTLFATLHAVLSEPVTPPSRLRPDVDPTLEAICLRALAKEPERRFPSAAAFCAALEGRPGPSPRALQAAALAALACAGLAATSLGWVWTRSLPRPGPAPGAGPEGATLPPAPRLEGLAGAVSAALEGGAPLEAWERLLELPPAAPRLEDLTLAVLAAIDDPEALLGVSAQSVETRQDWVRYARLHQATAAALAFDPVRTYARPPAPLLEDLSRALCVVAEGARATRSPFSTILLRRAIDAWIVRFHEEVPHVWQPAHQLLEGSPRPADRGVALSLELLLEFLKTRRQELAVKRGGPGSRAELAAAQDAALRTLDAHVSSLSDGEWAALPPLLQAEVLLVSLRGRPELARRNLRRWANRRPPALHPSDRFSLLCTHLASYLLVQSRASEGPDLPLVRQVSGLGRRARPPQAPPFSKLELLELELALCEGTLTQEAIARLPPELGRSVVEIAFTIQRARGSRADRRALLEQAYVDLEQLVRAEVNTQLRERRSLRVVYAATCHVRLLLGKEPQPGLLGKMTRELDNGRPANSSIPWYARYDPRLHRFPCERRPGDTRELLWLPPPPDGE
ncbi:MAG: serine/threonine protein kinase [Planctomycetes bacterium]|nr:serine/threonine protein kinase [Planctomycetota bacterium]